MRAPRCLGHDSGAYELGGGRKHVRITDSYYDKDVVLGQRGMFLHNVSIERACARLIAEHVSRGARRVQQGRACHLPGTKF
jgi:hypothetical protein